MDFFVWQGGRRRHSELWQRRATTLDGKRRDLMGTLVFGYSLNSRSVIFSLTLLSLLSGSVFAAPFVNSNNSRSSVNQKQSGLLNTQKANIGSVHGKSGSVTSVNVQVQVNQDQSGLLNKQEVNIGSVMR